MNSIVNMFYGLDESVENKKKYILKIKIIQYIIHQH